MIRLAEDRDLPVIEAIVHDAYGHYVSRIGRKPAPMLDDYRLLVHKGQVHVLEVIDIIHGLVVLIPEPDSLLLDNIAVSPGSQGRGYGRKLLQFAETVAREAGYGKIRLYTNEAMTENQRLYRRIGYIETHGAGEGGLRRVFMTKILPAPGAETLI